MMSNGLLLFGLIILVGFIGNMIFNKTRVPESIFLIITGIVLGPLLNIISPEFFLSNASFMISFALVVVLLESGLELDLSKIINHAGNAMLFTALVMISTVFLVTAVTVFFFHWPFINGIFLGVIGSGTTTVTIIHLLDKPSIGKNTKSLLIIESIINDVTLIISASIIISLMGVDSNTPLFKVIFNEIVISLLLGISTALLWIFFFVEYIHKNKLGYVFTLGLAFLIYSMVEYLGFNGAIAIMVFSLLIGNYSLIVNRMKSVAGFLKPLRSDISIVRTVNLEITFIIRTLFFVFLGVISNLGDMLSGTSILVIIIVTAEIASRYLSSQIISIFEPKFNNSVSIMSNLIARGFTSTLVAFLAIEGGINIPHIADIVLLLVVLTTIWSIVSISVLQWHSDVKKMEVY